LDYADPKRKDPFEQRTTSPPTTKRPALQPQSTDAGVGPPTVRARNYSLSEPSLEHLDEDDLELPATTRRSMDDFESMSEQTMPGITPPDPPSAQRDPIFHLKERYALGDFTGALTLAESILEGDPNNSIAAGYANNAKQVLVHMYSARLGSTNSRPSIVMPPEELRWLNLDHKAGFVLSLIDDSSTIEDIADMCGMPMLDLLRILYDLSLQKVIVTK
jgi:hypothetical protein